LASQLTGWELNVITDSEAKERTASEQDRLLSIFTEQLHVEEDVASLLIEEGFTSLEEVAYVPIQELLEIDGFDEEIVNELRSRAKESLLTQEIATEEKLNDKVLSEELLALPGMEKHLALVLANRGIITRDDLAELAVDDLRDISDLNETKAAELIMAARAHWFV